MLFILINFPPFCSIFGGCTTNPWLYFLLFINFKCGFVRFTRNNSRILFALETHEINPRFHVEFIISVECSFPKYKNCNLKFLLTTNFAFKTLLSVFFYYYFLFLPKKTKRKVIMHNSSKKKQNSKNSEAWNKNKII